MRWISTLCLPCHIKYITNKGLKNYSPKKTEKCSLREDKPDHDNLKMLLPDNI
jgi:hypothetical protein